MSFINRHSTYSRRPEADLRRSVLIKIAGQNLKKIEYVCILETYAQEFAKIVGNHARYSELVKENYRSIREQVHAICDAIRKETNTSAVLRPPTQDFDSDDSGAGKGEKSTTPQVLMGDEIESVLEPDVLFESALYFTFDRIRGDFGTILTQCSMNGLKNEGSHDRDCQEGEPVSCVESKEY